MQADIAFRPAYAIVNITLDAGEQVKGEAGALVTMSQGLQVQTNSGGGSFLGGLARSMLGGGTFFMNTFTGPGTVGLAPRVAGDIIEVPVGGLLYVQNSGFLASDVDIQVNASWGGARGFFGGAGLFMLKLEGTGRAWMASFGAIQEHPLAAGEKFTVDTGHLVAFEGSVQYQIRKFAGWKSAIFGGEGLVAEFTGPGKVWSQTRSPGPFAEWLAPFMPQQSSNR